jgi:hypothetical protein
MTDAKFSNPPLRGNRICHLESVICHPSRYKRGGYGSGCPPTPGMEVV